MPLYTAVIIIPLSNVTNVPFIQITPPRVILPQNLLLDDPTYDQPCVIYFEGSQRFLLSRSLCNLCYSIKRQRLSFLSVFFPSLRDHCASTAKVPPPPFVVIIRRRFKVSFLVVEETQKETRFSTTPCKTHGYSFAQ